MVNYCQECGEKIEDKFKFCPFCGKKIIKPKICLSCGNRLKDNFQFCPDCGAKWISSEKSDKIYDKKKEKNTGYENIVFEKKEESKVNKKKPSNLKKYKINFKFLKKVKKSKKFLSIFTIIVILIIVAAAIIIVNPFGPNNASSGNKSFDIIINNDYGDDIKYYFTVDGYYSVGALNNPFEIIDGDSRTITISENDLTIKKNSHSVTIYVTLDEMSWESDLAIGITETVSFSITELNDVIVLNHIVG